MNTITLFNAYAKARDGLHEVCVIIAAGDMPNDELARFMRMGARLERQCQIFESAMRTRLARHTFFVQLCDVQSQIINTKNDEIAALEQRVATLEAGAMEITEVQS